APATNAPRPAKTPPPRRNHSARRAQARQSTESQTYVVGMAPFLHCTSRLSHTSRRVCDSSSVRNCAQYVNKFIFHRLRTQPPSSKLTVSPVPLGVSIARNPAS